MEPWMFLTGGQNEEQSVQYTTSGKRDWLNNCVKPAGDILFC